MMMMKRRLDVYRARIVLFVSACSLFKQKEKKRQRESIAGYIEQEVRREIMFFFQQKTKRVSTRQTMKPPCVFFVGAL